MLRSLAGILVSIPLPCKVLPCSMLLFSLLALPACNTNTYRSVQTGGFSFDNTGEKRSQEETGGIEGDLHRIEIDHRFGAVKVYATDGDPEFTWSSTCWGRTADDAERFLEEVTLERTNTAGTHTFTLSIPENPGDDLRGIESVLVVHVPAATSVAIRNSFGDAEVVGIAGMVEGICAHCSVELESITGDLDWKTSFDDLRARNIAGGTLTNEHGELHVETARGDLTVRTSFEDATVVGVAGRVLATNEHGALTVRKVDGPVSAHTSFDALVVEEIEGDAHLRNSHGSISARAITGALDAHSSFGEIVVRVPSNRVKIVNSHASIRAELASASLEQVELETSFDDIEIQVPRAVEPVISVDQRHGDVSSPLAIHVDPAQPPAAGTKPRVSLKVRHGDILIEQGD